MYIYRDTYSTHQPLFFFLTVRSNQNSLAREGSGSVVVSYCCFVIVGITLLLQ